MRGLASRVEDDIARLPADTIRTIGEVLTRHLEASD